MRIPWKKLERYLTLIESLRKIGAPVSGIGVQEHAAEQFVQTDERPTSNSPSARNTRRSTL